MNQKNISEGKHSSLLNRIYDSGKGEKFNDLIKIQTKPKQYRAFLTNDDLSDVLVHLDKRHFPPPNNINKTEKQMKETQQIKDEETTKLKKTKKLENTKFNLDKSDLINTKKFEFIKNKHENFDDSKFFHQEKNEKKIQELSSITGYKTISPLPPSRGRRDNSYNPMIDRFKATYGTSETGFTKTNSKFGVSIYNAMEPKFHKPATTIISLYDTKYTVEDKKKDSKSVTNKTHINYNTSIPMNFLRPQEELVEEEDKNLMTINNLLTNVNEKKVNNFFVKIFIPKKIKNFIF